MPWVGFEPTIPVLERAKTFHILDRAATVIGTSGLIIIIIINCKWVLTRWQWYNNKTTDK
jgi:hypothetical protein